MRKVILHASESNSDYISLNPKSESFLEIFFPLIRTKIISKVEQVETNFFYQESYPKHQQKHALKNIMIVFNRTMLIKKTELKKSLEDINKL